MKEIEKTLELQLMQLLADDPRGVAMAECVESVKERISRSTVLRKLESLCAVGWVQRIGYRRGTRYQLSDNGRQRLLQKLGQVVDNPLQKSELGPKEPASPMVRKPISYQETGWVPRSVVRENPADEDEESIEEDLPHDGLKVAMSRESLELRSLVRQRVRTPCGYHREFLESYIPNQTAYLPQPLREKLWALGCPEGMETLPPGTYARQVIDRLIIDLSWNSGRLEGSTYSLLETDFLLQAGKTDDPKRASEARMILNHKTAIEMLVDWQDDLGFNRFTLLNLHAALTEALLKNSASEGRLREIAVGISGSVFHPLNQPVLISECFDLILSKAAEIKDPFECSFFLMVHMPYLQPFEDGNKRTSRLAANLPLIQHNLAPLSFVDVPIRDYTDAILSVYELNRIELLRDVYAFAYERSAFRYVAIREAIGDPDVVALRYREEMNECIRYVVVHLLGKLSAADYLRRWTAQHITASDRDRFIYLTEERLINLSEGNFVRLRLRPSEFRAWWAVWSGK